MPVTPLFFESILVDAIGLMVIILPLSVVAVAAFVPGHKNDARSD